MSQESEQNGNSLVSQKIASSWFLVALAISNCVSHTKAIFLVFTKRPLFALAPWNKSLEFSINHLGINYQNWHHDLGLCWQIGEIFLIAEMQ